MPNRREAVCTVWVRLSTWIFSGSQYVKGCREGARVGATQVYCSRWVKELEHGRVSRKRVLFGNPHVYLFAVTEVGNDVTSSKENPVVRCYGVTTIG